MNKYAVHFNEGVKGKLPVPGGGGDFCILIDKQMSGAEHFSLLVNSFQPGYVGPMHQHEVEHAWYILSGQGTITIGDETWDIGPDMAIFAPIGVPHQVACTGNEPMRYVVVYAPAGPEQDLRERGDQAFGGYGEKKS
jgi:mannose-6-phosphate isomerase-like protein (cupin superfamily)